MSDKATALETALRQVESELHLAEGNPHVTNALEIIKLALNPPPPPQEEQAKRR